MIRPTRPPMRSRIRSAARAGRGAVGWCVFAALLAVAASARAQVPDPASFATLFPPDIRSPGQAPGVTVLSRARPDYDPLPVRLGVLEARPGLTLGTGYDTDPAGLPGQAGSAESLIAPSLALGAGWGRDRLGVRLGAEDHRFASAPALDRTDWTAGAGLRLGFGRTRLSLAAVSHALHEEGSTIGALPTDRPLAYRLDAARVALRWSDRIVSLTPAVELASWRYATAVLDGIGIPQAYRDRVVGRAMLTARYRLDPGSDLVLTMRDTATHYTAPVAATPSHDSNAVAVLAGIEDAADPLLRVRLLAGWEQRRFAGYGARAAPIVEAQAIWQPDGLTTMTATAWRRMEDAAQEGVAGYTETAGSLALDRELRRNLILSLALGAQHAVFTDGAREDGADAGLAARWRLNRWLRVTATETVTVLQGTASALLPGGRRITRSVSLLRCGLGW